MVDNDETEHVEPGGVDVDRLVEEGLDEETFRALSDRERRFALYYLLEHSTATVEELADVVAGWTGVRESVVVSPADREAVLVELVHRHLPVLEAADLVERDPTTGTVALGTVRPAVREFLGWSRGRE